MGVADVAGKVWNSPNTAIGLAWGTLGIPFGARPTFGNNAVQFQNHPLQFFGDLTVGNAIFYHPMAGPNVDIHQDYLPGYTFGSHEIQHTYQGQILGPFYLPAYGAGIIGAMLNPIYGPNVFGPSNFMERGPSRPELTQLGLPPTPWP
jgi:hypothetical protein